MGSNFAGRATLLPLFKSQALQKMAIWNTTKGVFFSVYDIKIDLEGLAISNSWACGLSLVFRE